MKVGISYAVDLSEIPDELQKLVEEVQWDLSEKLELLTEQVKTGDFAAAFANIKNMRYNLQRTDTRLEDCSSILNGYLTVLKKLADEAAAEEAKRHEIGLGVRQSRPGPTKSTDAADD
jgi:uncharacterized protein (DUF849 family)|tara:strand:+ start:264 stop:617 length:354 start_codon:yes stop_codon:yes gene_type:complete